MFTNANYCIYKYIGSALKAKILISTFIIIGICVLVYFYNQDYLIYPEQNKSTSLKNKETLKKSDNINTVIKEREKKVTPLVVNEVIEQNNPRKSPTNLVLTIDQLLDDEDKTEKNKLIIQNHNNLISLFKDFRKVRKNKITNVTKDHLIEWTQSLIYDAYVTNELANKNLPQVDVSINIQLLPDLIPIEENLSRKLNLDYIQALKKLAKDVSSLDANSDKNLLPLANRLFDFTKRRKEQSEVFYLTLMHKYYLTEEYSIRDKILFAQHFVSAGDLKLAKYSLEYFEDVKDSQQNDTDQESVLQIIHNIKTGIKNNE